MRELNALFRERRWHRQQVEVSISVSLGVLEQLLDRIWEYFQLDLEEDDFLCKKDRGDASWQVAFCFPKKRRRELIDFLNAFSQQNALDFEAMELL